MHHACLIPGATWYPNHFSSIHFIMTSPLCPSKKPGKPNGNFLSIHRGHRERAAWVQLVLSACDILSFWTPAALSLCPGSLLPPSSFSVYLCIYYVKFCTLFSHHHCFCLFLFLATGNSWKQQDLK